MLRLRELSAGPLPVPENQISIRELQAVGTSTATPGASQLRLIEMTAEGVSLTTPWPVFVKWAGAWVNAFPYVKQDGEWVPL